MTISSRRARLSRMTGVGLTRPSTPPVKTAHCGWSAQLSIARPDNPEFCYYMPSGGSVVFLITRRKQFGPTTFLWDVHAPDVARAARPGHFVMARIDER